MKHTAIIISAIIAITLSSCGGEQPDITYQGLKIGQHATAYIRDGIRSALYSIIIDSALEGDTGQFKNCAYSRTGSLWEEGGTYRIYPLLTGYEISRASRFTITNLGGGTFSLTSSLAYPARTDTLSLTFMMQRETGGDGMNDISITQINGYGGFRFNYLRTPAFEGYTGLIDFSITHPLAIDSKVYIPHTNRTPQKTKAACSSAPANLDITFQSGKLDLHALSDEGEQRDANMQYMANNTVLVSFMDYTSVWSLEYNYLFY